MCVSHFGIGNGVGRVDEERNGGRSWDELMRQLDPFRHYLHTQLGYASAVTARSGETGDQSEPHRITANPDIVPHVIFRRVAMLRVIPLSAAGRPQLAERSRGLH